MVVPQEVQNTVDHQQLHFCQQGMLGGPGLCLRGRQRNGNIAILARPGVWIGLATSGLAATGFAAGKRQHVGGMVFA